MKSVGVFLTGLMAFVVLSSVLAGPANAGFNSSPTGCGATACGIDWTSFVHLNGSAGSSGGSGGGGNPVDITPPPCLWNPIGDATTGSDTILSEYGDNPPAIYGIDKSVQQAKDLKQNPQPGEWYELPDNPAASAAGQQECQKLPLFAWVPPNTAPPGLHIPPRTLAQYGFKMLETPQVSTLDVNPAGTSDTNLPTFVRAVLTPTGGDGQVHITNGRAWVGVTAWADGASVTVWAYSTGLDITPGTGNATPYTGGCDHLTQTDTGVEFGSGASAGQMAATQANQSIDCGVTYREPGTFDLQASIGWNACWAMTGAARTPPPLNLGGCRTVPGASALQARTGDKQITVRDIQSVNG